MCPSTTLAAFACCYIQSDKANGHQSGSNVKKPFSFSVYFPCSSESPELRGGCADCELNLGRMVRSVRSRTSTAKRDGDLRQPEEEVAGDSRRRRQGSGIGTNTQWREDRAA